MLLLGIVVLDTMEGSFFIVRKILQIEYSIVNILGTNLVPTCGGSLKYISWAKSP